VNPVFIAEITSRAFIQADSCKRRTLSRQDIVRALTKSDQFDFLIDIVPREEPLGATGGGSTGGKRGGAGAASKEAAGTASVVGAEAAEMQVRSVRFNMGTYEMLIVPCILRACSTDRQCPPVLPH
jgi:hypothetical protein